MSKPRVTLVTSTDYPNLDAGEEGLPDALAERGIDPQLRAWDDATVDWSEAGVCVLRSVHNYAPQRERFLNWAKTIPRLLNNADVVAWNSDKHYLKELHARGMPIIDTVWLEPERQLSKHQVHTRFPADGDFVVKPAISSGSRDTGRYTARDATSRMNAIQHAYGMLTEGRTVMVQRYLQSVDVRGETALIYLNGVLSHTVEKHGMLLGRMAEPDQVAEERAVPREATVAELRVGELSRAAIHGYIKDRMGRDVQLLYCRIDVAESEDGTPTVMEISATDAAMYAGTVPGVLDDFADAIASRVFW